ncbi:MAG TPA: SLC13 family permease [Candidatus Polarisedimenticolaceae bacterium]|nr:SLC13 family permease [Candidatus Polarisedimenticolaceae bacterium]
MTLPIALVLLLLVAAIANFAREWLSIEVFALLVMCALIATGILTPQQTFLGFANSAVVMIAGVMVLSGGVLHHGLADLIARNIARVGGGSERNNAGLLLASVTGLSSVINNVAATAMFIPVAEAMARRYQVPRARYLMAIAFASMTGGMCTLIGTSTNVAVAGAMEQLGMAPLRFFELTPVGVVVAVVGIAYLLWGAPRLLRAVPEQAAIELYGLKPYLYEILVPPDSPLGGRTLGEIDPGRLGVTILAIEREGERLVSPGAEEMILPRDLLFVEGTAATIPAVVAAPGLDVKSLPSDTAHLVTQDGRLVEATVSYNSPFLGKTLQELDFRRRFGVSVLAIHRREEVVVEKVGRIRLRAGDVLLVYGREAALRHLGDQPTWLLVETVTFPKIHTRKAVMASALFLGAIVVSAMGWLDAPSAFLAGGTLVIALKVLRTEEVVRYVNLRFLIVLAGMSALSMAMEKSGAAAFLADGVVETLHVRQPLLLAAVFFVLTVVLTQPLSNAAAALLVLPIAARAAAAVEIAPRPLAIAVTLAASCSFITPFEPACLLVYSTGNYRFLDFIRVGLPLTGLAFLITMALLPLLWPF